MPSFRSIALQAGVTVLVIFGLNWLSARNATARRLIKGNGFLTPVNGGGVTSVNPTNATEI